MTEIILNTLCTICSVWWCILRCFFSSNGVYMWWLLQQEACMRSTKSRVPANTHKKGETKSKCISVQNSQIFPLVPQMLFSQTDKSFFARTANKARGREPWILARLWHVALSDQMHVNLFRHIQSVQQSLQLQDLCLMFELIHTTRL